MLINDTCGNQLIFLQAGSASIIGHGQLQNGRQVNLQCGMQYQLSSPQGGELQQNLRYVYTTFQLRIDRMQRQFCGMFGIYYVYCMT